MKIRETPGRIVFKIINGMVLILLALLCVVPFVNVIAMSLSDRISVSSGIVTFWPVNFTFGSYHYLIRRAAFWQAFWHRCAAHRIGYSSKFDVNYYDGVSFVEAE